MIAFALTPAAISRLANVCRHSCRPIGSSPARRHAVRARLRTAVGVNGRCRARAEDQAVVAPGDELVLDEEVAERGDDRHAASAGAALRLTDLTVAAHAALDADQSGGEVDVVPEESSELAATQAGVERAAPERSILGTKRGDQRRGLGRRSDALAAAACRRKPEPLARVDCEVAVLDRAPVDHLQRLERIPDRARVGTRGEQLVDEALHVAPLELRELHAAERGEDVETQRALVLADNGRLVPLAGPRADRAARDPADECLCGVDEGLRGPGQPHAFGRLGVGRRAPAARLSERLERLRDLAFADRVVRGDAIARLAVTALAGLRSARPGVADFDSLGHQARLTLTRVALRSNQRSSSARAIRIRRPRRTTRSSSMTCSSR